MVRIIVIASGKGGVGKTTLVSNLATALTRFNQSVVAVDSNLSTSNLGIHLGIPTYPVTLQDVISGDARLKDALYHHPAGFNIIPAHIGINRLRAMPDDFIDVFYKLVDADFILIDCAAGLGDEALSVIEAVDEVITVTNPELPALVDALKLKEISNELGTFNTGVVVNRIKKEPNELSLKDVIEFLDLPLIGAVPEDHNIRYAIARKEPVVLCKPKSVSAQHFNSIAAYLLGRKYKTKIRTPFSQKLFGWLG